MEGPTVGGSWRGWDEATTLVRDIGSLFLSRPPLDPLVPSAFPVLRTWRRLEASMKPPPPRLYTVFFFRRHSNPALQPANNPSRRMPLRNGSVGPVGTLGVVGLNRDYTSSPCQFVTVYLATNGAVPQVSLSTLLVPTSTGCGAAWFCNMYQMHPNVALQIGRCGLNRQCGLHSDKRDTIRRGACIHQRSRDNMRHVSRATETRLSPVKIFPPSFFPHSSAHVHYCVHTAWDITAQWNNY